MFDLQIIAFLFYLHFMQYCFFFGIGIVKHFFLLLAIMCGTTGIKNIVWCIHLLYSLLVSNYYLLVLILTSR